MRGVKLRRALRSPRPRVGAATALATAGAAAAESAAQAAATERSAADTSAAVGGAAVAEGTGGWGAWLLWRAEGTADAAVWWGLPRAVELACADLFPPTEDADWGWAGRAGRPVARGRSGGCCTCSLRVAAIPLWR